MLKTIARVGIYRMYGAEAVTQAQIARLTGVSEVTIRKHYRLLKELIDGTTSATEAA